MIGCLVLEILCVEPIYLQYSGVLETCLALRYWFFEVLGSESVKVTNCYGWKDGQMDGSTDEVKQYTLR